MLIGLIGKARVGKTTMGNYLKDKYKFTKLAFADPLKQMLIKADLITYDEAYINKTSHSRELLQKIGTEIFRKQIDNDFWVETAKDILVSNYSIKGVIPETIKIVFDDIRFPNEAGLIKRYNGIIILVRRDNFLDNITDSNHDSEKLINGIPYNYFISSESGNIERLKVQMDTILLGII